MGNRSRGLQPSRHGLGILPAPSRAVAGVPVGRGRDRRNHRQPRTALPRPDALERARPYPEGASLRSQRQRGKSRRGREGVLLLPRLDADSLLHEVPLQVPSGGVSLRGPGERESSPRPPRARVRADRHRSLRGGPVFRRGCRVREGRARRRPRPHHRDQSRPRVGGATSAADSLVSQHMVVGHRRPRAAYPARRYRRRQIRCDRGRPRLARCAMALLRGRSRSPLHRERHERRAPVRTAERAPIREGLDQRVRRGGPEGRCQSGGRGHEGRGVLPVLARPRPQRGHAAPAFEHADSGRRIRQGIRRRLRSAGPGGRPVLREGYPQEAV
jgi:hypothetical protein